MSNVNNRPVPRPSIESQTVADETVLFDSERDMAFSLNVAARAIWELCDGSRTVGEISERLAEAADERSSDVREDVEEAIRELCRLELVTMKPPTEERTVNRVSNGA